MINQEVWNNYSDIEGLIWSNIYYNIKEANGPKLPTVGTSESQTKGWKIFSNYLAMQRLQSISSLRVPGADQSKRIKKRPSSLSFTKLTYEITYDPFDCWQLVLENMY